jgi:hypothetical protein
MYQKGKLETKKKFNIELFDVTHCRLGNNRHFEECSASTSVSNKPPRNFDSYVPVDTAYRPGRLEFINFTLKTSNLASEGLTDCTVEATVELRTVERMGGTSQWSDTWHHAYSHKVIVSKI